jgi:hypothetical protein
MRRFRQVIAVGAVIMVAGLALLRAGAAHGCGRGLAGARPARQRPRDGHGPRPRAVTMLARVTPEHADPAAGVLSTVQQADNALGVALLGIVS